MDDERAPLSLTEEKAARLLDRAAMLDAEGEPRVTIDELRAVALEAGISEDSFDRALAELGRDVSGTASVAAADATEPGAPVSVLRSSWSLLDERAGIFGTGSVLALFSLLFMNRMDSEPVAVFAVTASWRAASAG